MVKVEEAVPEETSSARTRSGIKREPVDEEHESNSNYDDVGASSSSGGRKRKDTRSLLERTLEEDNMRLKKQLEESKRELERMQEAKLVSDREFQNKVSTHGSDNKINNKKIDDLLIKVREKNKECESLKEKNKALSEDRDTLEAENSELKEKLKAATEALEVTVDKKPAVMKTNTDTLLEQEKERTVFYRTQMLELMSQMQSEQVAVGAPMPWKHCERCKSEFTKERKCLPLLLTGCGHTICFSCASLLTKAKMIKCPIDKQSTNVPNVTLLPVNKSLLNL